MRKYIILSLALALQIIAATNIQAAVLRGHIKDKAGEPLLGTNIVVVGVQKGASTDANGDYVISELIPRDYTLKVTLIGYAAKEQSVRVSEGETIANFELDIDPIFLGEIKVTAEREASGIDNSEPVRKEIIVAKDLQESSSDGGVLTALSSKTGLKVRPCSLCGSMAVGMQGLDPSYTEVNVDGLPLFSRLGTLYGLDGIAVADVSEVEVVKGSGSSLFGSGAIAGAVNLVSAKSSGKPSLRASLTGSDTQQHTLSFSTSQEVAAAPFHLSGTYSSEPQRVDRDNDGVTDVPQYQRLSLSTSLSRKLAGGELRLGGKVYREHRFAGETQWTEEDKGSTEVYGRDITTDRNEISLAYSSEPALQWKWSFEAGAVNHKQDSWYGTTEFNALQQILLAKGSIERDWDSRHRTLFQGIYQYEDYEDNLNLATPTDRLNRIPGVIAQHTWTIGPRWALQAGNRLEHINDYGWIFTPRGSLLWRPSDPWGIHLSGGSGFRPVTIFSLDRAVMAGFEKVIVPANLEPEKSVAASLAINRRWVQKTHTTMMDINIFYTTFSNMVVLAYGHEMGTTIYSNAKDAYSGGVEVQFTWRNTNGWRLSLGGTRSEVRYKDALGWHETSFQNRYTGTGSLEKVWSAAGFSTELSSTLYGPQKLPEGRVRSVSPTYVLLDWRIAKSLGPLEISASVKNLTDWTQPDNPYYYNPSTGKRGIDSGLYYGPLLGRTFFVSLTYSLGKNNTGE